MNKYDFSKNPNVNPKHYTNNNIQLIDIMSLELSKEEFKGFCKGLVLKYLCRADKKNGLEDYEKAKWYMDTLVEYLQKSEEVKNETV